MIKSQSSLARSEKTELSDAPSQGSEDSVSCRSKRGAIIQEVPIEVMAIIFGVLDKQDCAVAAVVCRGWSGVALDELWRSLPSLRPLFELLGPMEETDLGYALHPDSVLTAKSWDLFKSYGGRVRHFAYEDQNYDLGISSGLIMQALAVHPVGGILPNLQSVDWDVDGLRLNNILAFCPPSLRRMRLQIYTGNVEPEQVQRLLSGLSSSLANRLESFEFGADYLPTENAALSTALNTFIKTQRGLLELRLPSYYLQDPATVSAVCQALPRLRTFSAEVLGFTGEMFQVALNALATRSSSLRCIQLARSGNNSLEETMCLTDIEPLLELSVVEDVRLWFDFKMDLEVQNIRQMGQAWRKLAALILYSDQESQLHLSHLVTFAESFPALENFAAAFDCTGEIHNTGGVQSRFKSLRRLTLLGNPPQDRARQPLAEFLTMVCEPDVTVVFRPEGVDSSNVIACEFDWDRLGYHDPLTGEVRDWMAKLYQAQESTKQSH